MCYLQCLKKFYKFFTAKNMSDKYGEIEMQRLMIIDEYFDSINKYCTSLSNTKISKARE